MTIENYIENISQRYKLGNATEHTFRGDTRGWKMSEAKIAIANNTHNDFLLLISYRPFDMRTIYYSDSMVDWGREEVMKHLTQDKIALCLVRGRDTDAHNYFLSNNIIDKSISSSLDNANVFPLYIYYIKKLNKI